MVANWELALFIAGVILIILEIFVTPGFGVLGILGILAVVAGLAFAMIDTGLLRHIPTGELSVGVLLVPFMTVIISTSAALMLCVWLGNRFLKGDSRLRGKLVLVDDLLPEHGFVSRDTGRGLEGRRAVTSTRLNPSGKVLIDGRFCEAAGDNATFIEKGTTVVIVRDEGGVLYCRIDNSGE